MLPKHKLLLIRFLIIFSSIGFVEPLYSQLIFEKEEYAARRERIMDQISDGLMIIRGATEPPGYTQFYQNNNFMYLSGVEIPDVILLIDGRDRESYLFMTCDEHHARAEGLNISLVKDPVRISGIENVLPLDDLSSILNQKLEKSRILYAPFSPNEFMGEVSREKRNILQRTMVEDEWDGRAPRDLQFINILKSRYPHVTIEDCSPMLWDLRKIKSPAEIELMRECGRIGVEAHKTFMKATGVDVTEKYLANLFEFTCKNEGANGLGYYAIVMSGLNHAYGHYHKYDRILEDGDFIILDAGPDYKYYDVDISTTFPANGKFTKEQEEGYELALMVREICLENYKPGITLGDVGQKIKEVLMEKGIDPDGSKYTRWYKYGGYNHSIGMAVHDGMGTFDGTDEILKPGFVFACDIMTRTDSVTSVRIEDTVLITEDGCENLSKGLPRTVKEIEKFMKK